MSSSYVEEKPLDFLMRFQRLDDLQLETKDTVKPYNICSPQNVQGHLKIFRTTNMFVEQRLCLHPTSKIYFLGTQQQGRNNNQREVRKRISG